MLEYSQGNAVGVHKRQFCLTESNVSTLSEWPRWTQAIISDSQIALAALTASNGEWNPKKKGGKKIRENQESEGLAGRGTRNKGRKEGGRSGESMAVSAGDQRALRDQL